MPGILFLLIPQLLTAISISFISNLIPIQFVQVYVLMVPVIPKIISFGSILMVVILLTKEEENGLLERLSVGHLKIVI